MATTSQKIGLKILAWALVFGLFLSISGLQILTDQQKINRKLTAVETNILIEPKVFSADLTKKINLGFNQLIADYLWLRTIQYFGGGDYSKRYHALPKLLAAITDLDPKFVQPHLFAMLVLPYQKDVQAAIEIGERGLKNNPKIGLIPYYLGAIYHTEKKDYQRAAEAYAIAATKKDTPLAAKVLAGVSLSQMNEKQAAVAWWQGILETAKPDSYEYERAKIWLEHLLLQIQLEKIVSAFKEKEGRLPKNFEELVELKILPSLPQSPLGVKFLIAPDTGLVYYRKR